MESRRTFLKKLAVGTATAAAGPAAAVEVAEAALGERVLDTPLLQTLFRGPAPWWLLAPLHKGSALGLGWYLADLGEVTRGASVLTLVHRSRRRARVHLCVHGGAPVGVAHSGLIDLVLMDDHDGSGATEEDLGRVILGLAARIRRNEKSGELKGLARMMRHEERVAAFGAEELVG